jgi:archaetidylinositol phosphate synthase
MLESLVRPMCQTVFLDAIAKACARVVTANQMTAIALMVGVVAAITLDFGFITAAVIVLILSGVCDALDGSIARVRGESSSVGTLFDIISDRIVECAIVIALFLVNPVARALPSIVMLASIFLCVTAFLVVGAVVKEHDGHKGFFYSRGLIERFEAFIFFIAMMLFPAQCMVLAYVLSALVLLTAALHVWGYVKNVSV